MTFIKTIPAILLCLLFAACQDKPSTQAPQDAPAADEIIVPAAERFDAYLPILEGKSVAVVANATSMTGKRHLVDALLEKRIHVSKVFAPEHGFRGEADAGENISDEIDAQTGLPIFSLYGSQKKPSPELLSDIDVVIFDIQDVGVRFYTYLSTLHYVMEACAENGIPLIILDRPNPNGFYIDGPVLKPEFSSFIGLHPVPLVYGMTIGEYGRMINGEGWLASGVKTDLTVIEIGGYSHDKLYTLPVKPSPNLPNMRSIYLYPSLALFEGTQVSIGRGTDFPFQTVGHPKYDGGDFTFTPRPGPGAMYPKLDGELCRGFDLLRSADATAAPKAQMSLDWIIDFHAGLPDKEAFFLANNFFHKLAGNDVLMAQIKAGESAEDIRASWQDDLAEFRAMRDKYLLYK